jgi:hypothetical protein
MGGLRLEAPCWSSLVYVVILHDHSSGLHKCDADRRKTLKSPVILSGDSVSQMRPIKHHTSSDMMSTAKQAQPLTHAA